MGERRIGVALSDPSGLLAIPLLALTRKGDASDYRAVAALAQREAAEQIVVGLPLSLDGSIGPQAQRVLQFVRRLAAVCSVPLVTWDERFTSAEADRLLREAGVKPSREKGRQDSAAAAVLLQAYLDAQRRQEKR